MPILRKQKGGLVPWFLSVFLAFGGLTPRFLKCKFRCFYPPPSTTRASWIHVRRKYGDNKINFFIYYEVEVDGDTSKHHLDASNYGQENEWVLLVPAQ